MKVLVALDSFKESMSAKVACHSWAQGYLKARPQDVVEILPMCDGGEGTLETLIEAMNGKVEYYEVFDALMQKRSVGIGYVDSLAIIESALVCGLELLSEEQKNACLTTTYGLGELMKHAIEHGAKTLMICLGGSATNDGGIGMMSALNARFYDKHHQLIENNLNGLHHMDSFEFDKKLYRDIQVIGICDVQNILCGPNGATYVYGPQKGLKSNLQEHDEAMHQYALKVDGAYQKDCRHALSSGAAGGLGYAIFAFLDGQLKSGFDYICEILNVEKRIQECDCVIVGEGRMDQQTQYGKTPYGILKLAKKYHKKVYGFAGKIEDHEILKNLGFDSLYEISENLPLDVALKQGKENMEKCAYHFAREIKDEI